MPQFKDLNSLEKYLKSPQMTNKIFRDKKLKSILASTMSQAIYDVVYGAYVPKEYKRRRNNGGLGDVRNMNFTKVEVDGDKVRILFENLTLGQTHQVVYDRTKDTLQGQFITDTIVDGVESNWHKQGEWSEPRDFITETVRRIEANPSYLINAIKDAYRSVGFKIK